jgi:hypothetical protein
MSIPSTGPRPDRRHRRRRSPVVSIVLVAVGMVVLFGAGFGLSVIIRGAAGGADAGGNTAAPSPNGTSPTSEPCVTVTVTPGAGLPNPSQVTTNIFNSTDRAGLAASTAEELQARGFIIGTIDNDPLERAVSAPAEVRHGPSGESAATLMTYYIPGAVLVNDGRTDATIDTALGQAFTAVAAQAQVDAALLAPSPSPSGPGCPSPAATSNGALTPDEAPAPDTTGTAPVP